MIELLFVIVILGIVGGFVLEVIRKYYEGIFRTQEYTKRVAQADHILELTSKYFENAISSSIVNLDVNNTMNGCYGPPAGGDTSDYTVAFIGVDADSIRGSSGNRPGWNEEVQLIPGVNQISSSDSNYTMSGNIIHSLYPASPSDLTGSALYDYDSINSDACTRFGLNGGLLGSAGFHRITASTDTNLSLNAENIATDGHRKYLLRTAYAFRVDNNGIFRLYTNFRPWRGERYAGANAGANVRANILGENVAHFYADYNATDFMSNPGVSDRGLVWRLKVCMRGLDNNLSTSDSESQSICRERRIHVRF
jgi:hypothetical protein